MGVVYTIILPAGLIYFCVSSIYCLVKKCPMKLIFLPFMRQAAFSAQSTPTKKESAPNETQHVAPNPPPAIKPSSSDPKSQPIAEDPSPPEDPHAVPPSDPKPGAQSVIKFIEEPIVEPTSPAKIGAGIPNLGGTCYMNASLQALYRCEPFSPIVRSLSKVLKGNAEFEVICLLGEIFEYLADPKVVGDWIQPCPRELVTKFFAAFKENANWKYSTSDQCDAPEFMTTFLDYVQTRIDKLTQSQANDSVDRAKAAGIITDDEISALHLAGFYQPNRNTETSVTVDFGFFSLLQTFVQEVVDGQPVGEQFKVRESPVTFITVGVERGTVQKALDSLIATEAMECKLPGERRGNANLWEKFATVPSVLSIHPRRDVYNLETSTRKKLNGRFEFPNEIDFAQFTINPEISAPYELSSIMAHSGTADNGHYALYAKIDGRWIEFNDSGVREASASEIEALYGDGTSKMNAYMLFYKKVS
jgi:ubiquitin C-terminal hydrolase